MKDHAFVKEFLSPVKKTRVIEEILGKMRALLESGKLIEGSKLPPERDLCSMLSVSRPSLREALKVLDILGVIKTRQGSGTYTTGSFARIIRDPNKVRYIEQRFTLIELLEARRIIEPTLAMLAASRASEEDLQAMAKALRGMKGRMPSIEHDELFHRAIMDGADNGLLSQMMGIVWESLVETFRMTAQTTEQLQRSIANHSEVYLAIKGRNPQKAKRAMLRVLKLTETDLLKRKREPVSELRKWKAPV